LKALLAVEILKALDRERLSVRQAQVRTGIAAADFSRIRNADLGRFTLDGLMSIINRLGSRVDVRLKVRPASRGAHVATTEQSVAKRGVKSVGSGLVSCMRKLKSRVQLREMAI
jgi:predicted XRE-type DNA-binding protein